MQVSTDSNFNTIVYDSCAKNGSCNGSASSVQIPVLFDNPSTCINRCINYGDQYYWRVRVWQADGQSTVSSIKSYEYSFTHPGPSVIYNVPTNAKPGNTAVFVDKSNCYNSNGSSYDCKELTLDTCTAADTLNNHKCYKWNFGDNITRGENLSIVYTTGDATHIYPSAGSYSSNLRICDDEGCCSLTGSITIKSGNAGELPQWSEISPFQ